MKKIETISFKIIFTKDDFDTICKMYIAYILEFEPKIKITKKEILKRAITCCKQSGEDLINDFKIIEDNKNYDDESPEVVEIFNNLFNK